MIAGTAKVDITPPVGTELSGFVMREQPSLGVHSHLFCRALFLEHEKERMLWVHVDLIGFGRRWSEAIRHALQVPGEHLVLTATHTHSGPPTLPLEGCGRYRYEEAEIEKLASELKGAAESARSQPRPVDLRSGRYPCNIAMDRRRGLPIRSEVNVLRFRGADGNNIASLVHYAVHPVAMDAGNRLISGDIHGLAALALEAEEPGSIAFVLNGACGDLNPRHMSGSPQVAEAYGRELVEATKFAVAYAKPVPSALEVRTLGLQLPTEDGSRFAEAMQTHLKDNQEPWAERSKQAARNWNALAAILKTELRLVRIGNESYACVGAEPLSELQRRFPQVHIVGYSDATLGYLAPAEAYHEGGYETDSAFIYYGLPRMTRQAFDVVEEGLGSLIANG